MKIIDRLRIKVSVFMLLFIIPLIGVIIKGISVRQYLEFPPLTRYVEHAGFSWKVFFLMAIFIVGVVFPFVKHFVNYKKSDVGSNSKLKYPWWGWIGIITLGVSWLFAWSRFEWFAQYQIHTFTPLWVSYILIINAFTYKRAGCCMLKDRPFYLLMLFIISAVFWWYFEYLNRFVQNWYYTGIDHVSKIEYFIFATMAFSTVIPAVSSTYELLITYPGLYRGMDDFKKCTIPHSKMAGWIFFVIFGALLGLVGVLPNYLYPFLWISPLLIICSYQMIQGEKSIFYEIIDGRWTKIYLYAVSALICGFFWEMWNEYSLAKWVYSVPFVNRFFIFEMPILGFAGYLPFGLEALVVQDYFTANDEKIENEYLISKPTKVTNFTYISKVINLILIIAFALYFFIAPGFITSKNLMNPNVKGKGIPETAWQLHKNLTPRYAKWAKERIASMKAGNLDPHDVPSTEWPMFGSLFYLWGTVSLQLEWDKDPSLSMISPNVYSKEAIEVSLELILDPVHHTWVREQWGENYMRTENLFFRTIIIAGLTCHEKLLKTGKYLKMLKEETTSLMKEIDASPYGLLDDYPNECYPIDVLCGIACIKRAGDLLGEDYSSFIERSKRAFTGKMLDHYGLVPYLVNSKTGELEGISRGIGNSHVLIFSPELYPELAKKWYELYEKHFWQDKWWASGFREYYKFQDHLDYSFEVDAGPVIGGFSTAGCAFGIAAAKINGRLDHAFTLMTQALATFWPLPNGYLLGPQSVSNIEHAPYLGEACLLYFMAQVPHKNAEIVTGGKIPLWVFFILFLNFGIGFLMLVGSIFRYNVWRKKETKLIYYEKYQFLIWASLLFSGLLLLSQGSNFYGLIILLFSLYLPACEKESK